MDGRDLLIIAVVAALAFIATRLLHRPGGQCACGEPIEPGQAECNRCWWGRQAP